MCYGACQAVVLCHNAETFLQRGFPVPGSHSLVQIVYYRKAGIVQRVRLFMMRMHQSKSAEKRYFRLYGSTKVRLAKKA